MCADVLEAYESLAADLALLRRVAACRIPVSGARSCRKVASALPDPIGATRTSAMNAERDQLRQPSE